MGPDPAASRHLLLRFVGGTALFVGALVTAGAVFVSVVSLPSAAQITGNPMSMYNPFNVVTFGNVNISAESEGPLAVGGNLLFSNTQIDFSPAAGSSSSSLLVQGLGQFRRIERAARKCSRAPGRLRSTSGTWPARSAIDKDMNGASISLQVVAAGAQANSAPAITTVNNTQAPASVPQLPAFASALFDQSTATQIAQEVAANAGPTCDAGEVVTAPIVGGTVTIPMHSAGPTYWVVSNTDLSTVTQMNFSGSAARRRQPSRRGCHRIGPGDAEHEPDGEAETLRPSSSTCPP